MSKKTEFHTLDFFRKVRDDQAAALAGKTPEQIIAFFAAASRNRRRSNSDATPREMRSTHS